MRSSQCVVLLLTKAVLTRPWCLLELLTAIDAGVPIVGVTLVGKGYDFDEAAHFLTHLDTRLEPTTPGATGALAAHGYEADTAAHKLSSVLPRIIALQLNTSASRNVLAAVRHDACDNIKNARAIKLPPWSEVREEWLADRNVCTMKVTAVGLDPTTSGLCCSPTCCPAGA